MKLKGSLTTPTCGRFYGKKLNLVVLSQLVGFFNSLYIYDRNHASGDSTAKQTLYRSRDSVRELPL